MKPKHNQSTMAKGVQGVKVVNPMMGGDFDVPVDDDEDDLEVPLSPQVANAAEGVQTALGDAGEAAVEVRAAAIVSAATAPPSPSPRACSPVLCWPADHVEGPPVNPGVRDVRFLPVGFLLAGDCLDRHPCFHEARATFSRGASLHFALPPRLCCFNCDGAHTCL